MNYKVKVIQIALRNNKLAKSGDVVSEAQLTGNANDLEKAGFIEKVSDKSKDSAKAVKAAEKAKKDAEVKAEAENKAFDEAFAAGSLNADQLDGITKDAIYGYAQKHSLKFDEKSNKTDLIQDVLKAEKA